MKYLNMTKSLFLFAILSLGLVAQPIQSLDQTISISADGSAVVTFDLSVLSEDSLESLQIPVEYEEIDITSVMLDGIDITEGAEIIIDRSLPIMNLEFGEPIQGEHTLKIATELQEFLDWDKAGPEEFKTYNWEVYYTNSLPKSIGECRLTVILPDGWNFHRITGSDPKFKKKEPKPPYLFAHQGNQASVTIARSPMQYMDSVRIEFAFKNERKPNVLIWIGLLLSAAYLYYFKHLVKTKDVEEKNNVKNNKESK